MDLFGNAEHVTVWDIVRHWMGRPMLTKLLKEHGKDAIKAAVLKTLADEAVEQLPYLIGILKGDKGEAKNGKQIWQESDERLLTMARERGIGTSGKSRQELINVLR